MPDKQNIAAKIISAWQEQFQDCLKDPRLIDTMMENYARFQENINAAVNANEQGASGPLPDDVVTRLDGLGKLVGELSKRLAVLEKTVAGNTKATPGKPKTTK